MGAYDAFERAVGPICDDCLSKIVLSDESLADLAESLEELEQSDPVVRNARKNLDRAVRLILDTGIDRAARMLGTDTGKAH